MVNSYKKKEQTKLSSHFFSTDFDCHCEYPQCDVTLVDEDLVSGLEDLWSLSSGFIIDSGFRCERHNTEIGGVSHSQHKLGRAADCRSVKNYTGNLMARYAEEIKVFRLGGIGIYLNFVHVDVRKGPVRWGYPQIC